MNSQQNAARRYETAFQAMCENSIADYAAGIDYETERSGVLNSAVINAAPGVAAWRRWLIQRRVIRALDYWQQMGGTG